MDDKSSESAEEDNVTSMGKGESELRRLKWGWSWFQRQGEVYWNKQTAAYSYDEAGGQARVTTGEQQGMW